MSHPLDSEIERLREVLWSDRDPQGRAFASLAEAYRQRGDLPLARSMVVEGLERLPEFASGYVVAGRVHRDLGSPVEADQSFRRVLDLDPENAVALQAMGELAEERGSHAEAAEYFRRLSVLAPQEESGSDGAVAAVPVDELKPEPELEGADSPIAAAETPAAEEEQAASEGQWVPVADLAPDDDSFDFAVTDLDDVTPAATAEDLAAAAEAEVPAAASVPDWSWTPGDDEESVAAVTDVEEVEVEEVEVAPDVVVAAEAEVVEPPPVVEAEPAAVESEAPAPTPVEELAPAGPRLADAVPIASLAPDIPTDGLESAPGEVSPVPVAQLGPDPQEEAGGPGPAVAEGAGEESEGEIAEQSGTSEGPEAGASDPAEDDGDSDDFQAWLERNSP